MLGGLKAPWAVGRVSEVLAMQAAPLYANGVQLVARVGPVLLQRLHLGLCFLQDCQRGRGHRQGTTSATTTTTAAAAAAGGDARRLRRVGSVHTHEQLAGRWQGWRRERSTAAARAIVTNSGNN